MDPEAAILKWMKPVTIKAGMNPDYLWTDTLIERNETNPDYDDKIFKLENYESIKVDAQHYLNNAGIYLVFDNTVKEPTGSRDLMRLELHDYPESADLFWTIQPHVTRHMDIFKKNYTDWKNAIASDILRSPSNYDIYLLIEYLGGTFKPLNWTSFPTSLLPEI